MYAVIVRETGDADRIDQSGDTVLGQVAPRLREAHGFHSAVWTSDGMGGTLNVLVFESEESARVALEAAKAAPRPPFMTVDSVSPVRVIASI